VMITYKTMTTGGIVAGTITADNDAVAQRVARERGYTVLDVMDADRGDDCDAVIVVSDDASPRK
jgi:hypothetical protein